LSRAGARPCAWRPAVYGAAGRGYKGLVDRCARCGASLGEGHRFCGNCGAPVGGCPGCGEPVIEGNRFCHACGHALAELAAASPVAATVPPDDAAADGPVAERRVCSVLFCDLVGFTPLSEARDPEAVRELLSQYFAAARTVIGRYGGVVEKFIGDAVMAVWGTPVATEGDAERAVRAGLDLVAAVAQLGAEAGASGLAARAGVVTGEVAVTLGAAGEGMVAGDAVNTAARVQAAAGPGQVLADGATQRLAEGGVGFADAGAHALKGKAEPARLWRATRVLAGIGGSQRVDGLGRYVPDPDERAYVGARLGRLLGVAWAENDGAALAREELFAGWRLFFERLTAEHPVVLVVEDAQYADAGLLDFLDYLIDWSRDLPVYLLVLARPELGQARPGFGTGRNRTTLTLDPLDAASMDALVDALSRGCHRRPGRRSPARPRASRCSRWRRSGR
jgi:class 3 adenylate cyclase